MVPVQGLSERSSGALSHLRSAGSDDGLRVVEMDHGPMDDWIITFMNTFGVAHNCRKPAGTLSGDQVRLSWNSFWRLGACTS